MTENGINNKFNVVDDKTKTVHECQTDISRYIQANGIRVHPGTKAKMRCVIEILARIIVPIREFVLLDILENVYGYGKPSKKIIQIMVDAGIVAKEKRGKAVYYKLIPKVRIEEHRAIDPALIEVLRIILGYIKLESIPHSIDDKFKMAIEALLKILNEFYEDHSDNTEIEQVEDIENKLRTALNVLIWYKRQKEV